MLGGMPYGPGGRVSEASIWGRCVAAPYQVGRTARVRGVRREALRSVQEREDVQAVQPLHVGTGQ